MSEQKIVPGAVTKPIQLLAAWLVGLILINASFLGAAKVITSPEWAAGALVMAAVLNVPVFLALIFFLQTRFRAELQEDTFYSKHLEKITGSKARFSKNDIVYREVGRLQQSFDEGFEILKLRIDELSRGAASHLNTQNEGGFSERVAEEARKAVESLEEKKLRNKTRLALNDLIPGYREIALELAKIGYAVSDTFGSDNGDGELPPELTISFLPWANKQAIKEVYTIARNFGFNRIDYDNIECMAGEADIYIGSYIDKFKEARGSVFIDKDLEGKILDPQISIEELGSYIASIRRNEE